MTINYFYSTNMTIIFDSTLEMSLDGTLDSALNKIEWAFDNYPFTSADVIDSNTGELLMQVTA